MGIMRRNGKRTRALVDAIVRSGGEVEQTTKGHLRVTGPTGVTVVGSRHGSPSARSDLNIKTTLRRMTGLKLG